MRERWVDVPLSGRAAPAGVQPHHPPTSGALTGAGGCFQEKCLNFIFSSPSHRQKPSVRAESPRPAPAHQVSEKPPTAAPAAGLQRGNLTLLSILFGTPVPFLALAASLLIYSWCHMKSQAGTAPPALCSPAPTQGSPAPPGSQRCSLVPSSRMCPRPSLNSVLTCTGSFLFCLPLSFFSIFLKETESKAAV